MDSSSGLSQRSTIISGFTPMPCSSFTECWVGLDLCSSEPLKKGTSVTWMNRLFSLPTSREIWRAASMNGWDSMSPMISVITTSAPV